MMKISKIDNKQKNKVYTRSVIQSYWTAKSACKHLNLYFMITINYYMTFCNILFLPYAFYGFD